MQPGQVVRMKVITVLKPLVSKDCSQTIVWTGLTTPRRSSACVVSVYFVLCETLYSNRCYIMAEFKFFTLLWKVPPPFIMRWSPERACVTVSTLAYHDGILQNIYCIAQGRFERVHDWWLSLFYLGHNRCSRFNMTNLFKQYTVYYWYIGRYIDVWRSSLTSKMATQVICSLRYSQWKERTKTVKEIIFHVLRSLNILDGVLEICCIFRSIKISVSGKNAKLHKWDLITELTNPLHFKCTIKPSSILTF